MIDLTPLDVRSKRGDFRRTFRGYDPEEVDIFLELVAERLEALVRENLRLGERAELLGEQVESQSSRERAVQEALVTAQELRDEIQAQAKREAELVRRTAEEDARRILEEARSEAERVRSAAERQVTLMQDLLDELARRRSRFLRSFRSLLERELDGVEIEERREPPAELPVPAAAREDDAGEDDEVVSMADLAADPVDGAPDEAAPDDEPAETDVSGLAAVRFEDAPDGSLDADFADAPADDPPVPDVPTFEELMDETEGAGGGAGGSGPLFSGLDDDGAAPGDR